MRLIHIHLGIKGGAERFFVALVNALAERGVEQHAFVFPDRIWRADIEPVCTVHEGNYSRSHISRYFTNRSISRIARDFEADAFISWMPQASRWIPAKGDMLRAARLGDYPEKLDYFENCDLLICNTPDIARHCADIGWKRDLEVISNFTETQPVPALDRKVLDTPDDAFVVLGMGRFVDRKGFDTLIRAVSRLDGAYLWLLGEGEEEENLRRIAAETGLEPRLRFGGWVKDPGAHLAACDTFCIPSSHEPLGNVVLEAWAARRPVVSTTSEGPGWLIEDGVHGLLAPIGDDAKLAEALARVRIEPGLADAMIAAGAEKLAAEFSKDVIAQRYIKTLFG
ncbi:glycosyltransferase involved in cell wall biosynthesis [Breoghania corrubedonensis]|uniref:Glycosyltransferase involved in cell wall biosynthesis n=1 Tax=Breoghania corrubedonensis TaxID=665038 RepID=A0A2T5V9I9_9HYPH|nr:glycosyltransferase [Breoghania corrubedonensis]PTW60425.1 glycosyltransferase involved in cell wall biosynthesis [Breoghania corrubedonensis]